MSKLQDKVTKIRGSFSSIINGDELALVAIALNKNAEILKEVIKIIDKQQEQIKQLKAEIEEMRGVENE